LLCGEVDKFAGLGEIMDEVKAVMRDQRSWGVDIRSAKFWQGDFDVLSKMVDELEKL